MRNYPVWIVAFAAITSIGGIAVALNAWWVTDELEYGLKDSGSKLVIVDEERVKRIAPILEAALPCFLGMGLSWRAVIVARPRVHPLTSGLPRTQSPCR